MQQYINGNTIANEIRMKASYKKSFVIVEGPSDAKIYRTFMNESVSSIVISYGRVNLTKAATILDKDDFEGFIAIVDADFDVIDGIPEPSPNAFFTDTSDLESMMLNSHAFESMLSEYLPPEKQLDSLSSKLRDKMLQIGVEMGYLRWVSGLEKLPIKIKGRINYRDCINLTDISANLTHILATAKHKTDECHLTDEQILEKISYLKMQEHDEWHICNGHDLIEILSVILSHYVTKWYNSAPRTIVDNLKPKSIDRSLRLSYNMELFRESKLYKQIKDWEASNPNHPILKN